MKEKPIVLKRGMDFYSILAFIFGLLTTTNVVYVLRVGTTLIDPFTIYSLFLFCLFFLNKRRRRPFSLPLPIAIFLVGMVVSVLPVIAFNFRYVGLWARGMIGFALIIPALLDAYYLKKYYESICKGILFGLLINFVIVALELYCHKKGIWFNLGDYFPLSSVALVSSRCQGLFREPGHLMRYICISYFFLMPYISKKNFIFKVLYHLIVFAMAACTVSSSIVFLAIGIVLMFILEKEKLVKRLLITLAMLCFLGVSVFVAYSSSEYIKEIVDSLFGGFSDIGGELNKTDGPRIISIRALFGLCQEYFVIGSGYNTAANLLYDQGLKDLGVLGAYSFGLRLICELGVFAFFGFVGLIKIAFNKIVKRDRLDVFLGISLIVYLLLSFATDYGFSPEVIVLFGFAIINEKGEFARTHVFDEPHGSNRFESTYRI